MLVIAGLVVLESSASLPATATAASNGDPPRFVMESWTIDGGGTTIAVGGRFVLSGSVAQVDASPQLEGGTRLLSPGFWTSAEPVLEQILSDGFE